VGHPSQALAITGRGFSLRSVAAWNGAQRPTAFISDIELQVQLTAGDLDRPGSVSQGCQSIPRWRDRFRNLSLLPTPFRT